MMIKKAIKKLIIDLLQVIIMLIFVMAVVTEVLTRFTCQGQIINEGFNLSKCVKNKTDKTIYYGLKH
jgi:hypothetical protein